METISAKELEWYAKIGSTLIIDLRPRKDYLRSHVPGAVNVPQGVFENQLSGRKGETIILYCERGALSMSVARQLEQKGYKTRSVVGGFRAYRGKKEADND